MNIEASCGTLKFQEVPISFIARGLGNLFTKKNNKSVRETLGHHRYGSLAALVQTRYPASIDIPLGQFLNDLKANGDPVYRRFLNPHGDNQYCHFKMGMTPYSNERGLYCYSLESEIVYVGRSLDPFKKRIDQGYGKIHPKNCYIDGQSTNCHLNSLIEANSEKVRLWVCPIHQTELISDLERDVIGRLKPKWNVALRN